jgi:tetratricopeptide (TPR) repeat protein
VRLRSIANRLLPAALPLWLCAGCATYEPPAPVAAFASGDLGSMEAYCHEQLTNGNPNSRALYENLLGTVQLLHGDRDAALKSFRSAGAFMGNWNVSGNEEFAAIVGSESSKHYRGDPYEKAMNAVYLGLLYWMRGEPDNARAAFKKGILADAESDGEAYQVDFALLFWLAGRASLDMGLRADAEGFFDEARRAQAFAVEHGAAVTPNARVLREPAAGNLLCVIDVGLGPEKYEGGPNGTMACFRPRPSAVVCAEAYVDGRSIGTSEPLVDLYYQASTRGGTVMEGIRKGKAVFKDISAVAGFVLINEGLSGRHSDAQLAVGLGLLALSLLSSSSADTRHWSILPDSVQLLTAYVSPGSHQMRLVYRDGSGHELAELTQTWTVVVPESGEGVYYFRSIPGLDRQQSKVNS